MSTTSIIVNSVAPESIQVNITDARARLAAVTAVSLLAKQPNGGSVETWVGGTISNQTPTGLTVTYSFNSGDLPVAGKWQLAAVMTLPGGSIGTLSADFFVQNQFH